MLNINQIWEIYFATCKILQRVRESESRSDGDREHEKKKIKKLKKKC